MIASIFDVLSKMLMQPSRVHVSQDQKRLIYKCCLCALYNHVDNIFIRFGSRFYSQIVGKIMGRGKICIEYSDVTNYNCNRRGLLTIKGNPVFRQVNKRGYW